MQAQHLAAKALLGLKDFEEALRMLRAPLANRPDDTRLLATLSWAQLGAGWAESAVRTATERVRLAPTDWAAWADLASIRTQTGLPDDETLRAAQEAVRLAPAQPPAHVRLGNLHLARREWLQARAAYREALRLDPQNRVARHNLALVDLRSGRPTVALGAYARMAGERPDDETVTRNIVAAVARTAVFVSLPAILLAGVLNLLHGATDEPVRIGCAVVAAMILVALVVLIARHVGRHARAVALLILRTRRLIAIGVVCSLAALVMMIAFVGLSDDAATAWYPLCELAAAAGTALNALGRRFIR